jgi:16S rRNA (guanine1516-N2)-methyltransferase
MPGSSAQAHAGIAVIAADASLDAKAAALAQELGLPFLRASAAPVLPGLQALLRVEVDGLALQAVSSSGQAPGPVSVDFGAGAMRHRRRGGQNELLGKAVGVGKKRGLSVLDATAGLARDSFVLADLGCHLLLTEREPVVGALVAAGLARAMRSPDPWLAEVVSRMRLHRGCATHLLAPQLAGVDVIYLDPMFPERDKSAAVKKEMALFQSLFVRSNAEDDAGALLDWALHCNVARVVVKRPLRAPPLCLQRPSHAIVGKAVRYDVYVLRSLGQTA